MPLSVRVQPIDSLEEPKEPPASAPKPVVKSRLRRLFRISVGGGGDEPAAAAAGDHCFEPSSVCLAKMVQNFIEENNNEKQSVKCGRSRCNCFNGGSDSSDTEPDVLDADDFLKSLVVCTSVSERNVLGDTAKIIERISKAGKRKDDLRKAVVVALVGLGYDACVCKSKWEKSPSFPAGEYEYVDVIIGGSERLIVDVDFRSEFEIARSTKSYKSILQTLPNLFVGKPDRLKKIIAVASEAVKQSLKKKGMHFPPWRKAEYLEAKWLSPYNRLLLAPSPASSPAAPGVVDSDEGLTDADEEFTKLVSGKSGEEEEEGVEVEEGEGVGEGESSSSCPPLHGDGDSLFAMSESSGEDEGEAKNI